MDVLDFSEFDDGMLTEDSSTSNNSDDIFLEVTYICLDCDETLTLTKDFNIETGNLTSFGIKCNCTEAEHKSNPQEALKEWKQKANWTTKEEISFSDLL